MTIGTVTGQSVAKNPPGTADVRLLQVRMSNDSDIKTVQWYPLPGDDSPPQIDDLVAVLEISSSFRIAVGVQDSVVPSMLEGERKLFSRDSSGDIAAFINLLTGGDIELNGNANTAVRFAALQTAFDELKNIVNTHTHLYTPGVGTPTQTAAGTQQSSADITPAESVTVKLL